MTDLLTNPLLILILIKLIAALPIAYVAKKRGYSYGLFFACAFLLETITTIVFICVLPNRTKQSPHASM